MAAAFALVVAPNVWWLFNNDFMPLQYVDDRALTATRWYHYLVFPLQWTGSQVLYLAPALALLALLYAPRVPAMPQPTDDVAAFNRRYVLTLAVGPFAVITVIATLAGRLPVALWGYPLWSFAPLAVLVLFPPALEPARLRRFAGALLAVLIGFPAAFTAIEIGESLVSDRSKATQFPGQLLANTVTRQWRAKTGTPLAYVGGAVVIDDSRGRIRELGGAGQFASNNVAVYSPDRPRVIVNGELRRSPWIDAADLDRRGAVLVWQSYKPGLADNLQRAFPRAELQPPLQFPRRTFFSASEDTVYYAIVPPRP